MLASNIEQMPTAGIIDCSQAMCVIGAGPSGLAVLKSFAVAGIAVQGFEAQDDVGGNWYFDSPASSVCDSTHLISSKKLTEFADFPMPEEYPPFPSHRQALEYLRSYAHHFGLHEHFQFNTRVVRIEKSGEHWLVQFNDNTTRRFRGVVIANGHHAVPNMPELPGYFAGHVMHSHDFKTSDSLRDQRVLVVGAGNSGCDIAVEAGRVARSCAISMRRGYYFVPKFFRGKPIDEVGETLLRWRIPLALRRFLVSRLARMSLGPLEKYNLPRPDHRFFETHPIINSQLLYSIGHGQVVPKPAISNVADLTVTFADGSKLEVDTILFATGYQLVFPFIDMQLLNGQNGVPRLYLHAFHPSEDRLFVAGMIQPDSGQWGLTDLQAQIMAQFIIAQDHNTNVAEWFRRLKAGQQPNLSGGINYLDSPRHALEVEHYSYRRRLQKIIRQFDRQKITSSMAKK